MQIVVICAMWETEKRCAEETVCMPNHCTVASITSRTIFPVECLRRPTVYYDAIFFAHFSARSTYESTHKMHWVRRLLLNTSQDAQQEKQMDFSNFSYKFRRIILRSLCSSRTNCSKDSTALDYKRIADEISVPFHRVLLQQSHL